MTQTVLSHLQLAASQRRAGAACYGDPREPCRGLAMPWVRSRKASQEGLAQSSTLSVSPPGPQIAPFLAVPTRLDLEEPQV